MAFRFGRRKRDELEEETTYLEEDLTETPIYTTYIRLYSLTYNAAANVAGKWRTQVRESIKPYIKDGRSVEDFLFWLKLKEQQKRRMIVLEQAVAYPIIIAVCLSLYMAQMVIGVISLLACAIVVLVELRDDTRKAEFYKAYIEAIESFTPGEIDALQELSAS